MEETMQERGVHRIDADLERLQPITVDHALEGEGVTLRRNEAVKVRECWRLARSEIGEQNAASRQDGIRFLPDIGAEIAAVGLGRRLQTLAVHIEKPAMEG